MQFINAPNLQNIYHIRKLDENQIYHLYIRSDADTNNDDSVEWKENLDNGYFISVTQYWMLFAVWFETCYHSHAFTILFSVTRNFIISIIYDVVLRGDIYGMEPNRKGIKQYS